MDQLYFDLQRTDDPLLWKLPITEAVSAGAYEKRFLFGGVALGASIEAMQRVCERPLVWATGQYLSFGRKGQVADIAVQVVVNGNNVRQARVSGRVEGEEIFTVNAALGKREGELSGQWWTMPDAPPPEDCETVSHWRGLRGVHAGMEIRLAGGRYGYSVEGEAEPKGGVRLWMKTKADLPINASLLAIIADQTPAGIGAAVGRLVGGNSLDNTLRIRRIVPTQWVLMDIQMDGLHAGFAHLSSRLFAQDGELMATASQSMIVREHVADS